MLHNSDLPKQNIVWHSYKTKFDIWRISSSGDTVSDNVCKVVLETVSGECVQSDETYNLFSPATHILTIGQPFYASTPHIVLFKANGSLELHVAPYVWCNCLPGTSWLCHCHKTFYCRNKKKGRYGFFLSWCHCLDLLVLVFFHNSFNVDDVPYIDAHARPCLSGLSPMRSLGHASTYITHLID